MSSGFQQTLDEGLIRQARGGERAALELLYRRFEAPVYTLALRLCGDPSEAEDLMQDSFMKAFAALKDWRGDAPFGCWLRRITANTSLLHLRHKRRFDVLPELPELASEEPPAHTVDPGELAAALQRLPSLTRAVLWMYEVEGWTHEEIARAMDRSVSFSKSQLSRGRARLRSILNPVEETHWCPANS